VRIILENVEMEQTVDNTAPSHIHQCGPSDEYDITNHARLKIADPLLGRTPDRTPNDSYYNRKQRLPVRANPDSKIEDPR
jgi:hypothetical protein